MITKTENEISGSKVIIEGGDIKEVSPIGTTKGTIMNVTNLFFNTPVRYRFLKKNYTEAGYVEEVVRKLALVNKNIAFKFINNSKVILQTPGNDDFKSTIYSIYGAEIADSIVEVSYKDSNVEIEGVVGKPEIARSNRRNQIFFVNGRPIKDKTLTAAADKAFKGLVPLRKIWFLYFESKNRSKND